MATRSLTDVFVLMRNNASQNRHIYSEQAAIVGFTTRKVIYIGVKNKFCTTCARAEFNNTRTKYHVCYKNWDSSSSSMESNIIAEGFRVSEEMYGARYARLIADGDSNVYNTLRVSTSREVGNMGEFSEQMTDRMALVGDVESGIELRRSESSRLPPIWVDNLEESHYAMSRLKNKLKELEALYDKHVLRPTLDDSSDEEQQIEILTQEISRMFAATHRLVQQIHHQSADATTKMELRLSHNVTASLVSTLQDLSNSFRKLQSSYLKKINSREETSRLFFDTEPMARENSLDWDVDNEIDNLDRAFSLSTGQQSWGGGGGVRGVQTQTQLLLLEEENSRVAEHREAEVRHIVKSIVDLNDIFKDLAHMVADQGTVLDRIDYNIEQTQVRVHEGYQQLQKADAMHRKNRKMMCILILGAITMLLTFILIVVKL